MRRTRGFVPLGETVSVVLSGVTLLQREALEASPGGASTVKVEAVVCTTLTAHSEPYNRAALHASRLGKGANALRSCDFGERCGRENPRLAAATSLAASDRHRQSQCLRVLQRSTAVCAGAKNTKSLAARAGGCGAGGEPIPSANAVWHTNGHVSVSDVAARDVQAATPPCLRHTVVPAGIPDGVPRQACPGPLSLAY